MCTAMALYVAFSEPAAPSISTYLSQKCHFTAPVNCPVTMAFNFAYIPPGQHEIYKYSTTFEITIVSLFQEKDAGFPISGFLMYSRLALTNLATRKVKTMHLLLEILCKVLGNPNTDIINI